MSDILLQAFIYLCAAVVAVPIAKRLGLGSVLGYLIAGMAIGPFGLGLVVRATSEAGIREVWLIALERQVIEVYRDPSGAGYRWAETRRAGDTLAPIALPDLELGLSELFG